MKKVLGVALAGLLLVGAGSARADHYRHQNIAGELLGAAIGGLIGSQIGNGNGRAAAVGAGVFLGSRLGRNMNGGHGGHRRYGGYNSGHGRCTSQVVYDHRTGQYRQYVTRCRDNYYAPSPQHNPW